MFGLILLVSCLGTAVCAMEVNNSTNSAYGDDNSEWILPPEGADALANLYLADLKVIAHSSGYLLTGNETQKQRLLDLQTDSDGSINGYLDVLDLMVADNPQAKEDYQSIYGAWDTMNASTTQVVTSFEEDGSPNMDVLAAFEQAAVNLTDTFDTFIGTYYTPGEHEEKLFRKYMIADLAGAVNSQAAYDLSGDPVHKAVFMRKMMDFDLKRDQYLNLHPDLSIDELNEMKSSLETFVTREFEILDEGKELSKEELGELTVIINKINGGLENLLKE